MENNIFRFATKELSQDAFIAWLINWINDEQNSEMKKLAKKFLKNIISKKNRWIKLLEEDRIKVDVEVQFYNIDVLIMIYDENRNKYMVVIIEDKVNTTEHDSQIERYKNELKINLEKVEKYKNRSEKIEEILTCYYKPYDECGIDEKNVDFIYQRKDIKRLFQDYKDIKQEYVKQYIEYIEAIDKCAEKYKNENICNLIVEKKKYDIKYAAFFNKLENDYKNYINSFSKPEKYKEEYIGLSTKKNGKSKKIIPIEYVKNEKVYFGTDTSGNEKTWWCNIPINFKIESNIFNEYAFIKINFYKEKPATVMLKISKIRKALKDINLFENKEMANDKPIKYYDPHTNEYYNIYNQYDRRRFSNQNVYRDILNKLNISETKKIETEFGKFKVEQSGMGSTKTQSEMNIFTIKIPNTNELGEKFILEYKINAIESIILAIKNKLNGKMIKINTLDETSNLEVK